VRPHSLLPGMRESGVMMRMEREMEAGAGGGAGVCRGCRILAAQG